MITRGLDKPLYALPFDHRGSFESRLFGAKVALPGNTGFSAREFRPRLGLEHTYNSKNLR
jgi:hypothetical protein